MQSAIEEGYIWEDDDITGYDPNKTHDAIIDLLEDYGVINYLNGNEA